MSTTRPLALAAVTAVLVGGLSGCGVAGTDFHPGVAAQVGDSSISVSHVDTVADDYCAAIEPNLAQQQQVLPMRYLRGGVAGQLTLVEAAQQFAAERGVDAGEAYTQKVAQLRDATASLSQDQRDAVIEMESAGAYIGGIEQAVGEQEGQTGAKAAKAGDQAFARWLDDQDVSIDPQFGVTIDQARAVPTDTGVSFAVSDQAKAADADSPDPSYAAGLADSQRCGG